MVTVTSFTLLHQFRALKTCLAISHRKTNGGGLA